MESGIRGGFVVSVQRVLLRRIEIRRMDSCGRF